MLFKGMQASSFASALQKDFQNWLKVGLLAKKFAPNIATAWISEKMKGEKRNVGVFTCID